MSKRRRLTGEERRESILGAARRVFAERGFPGTTTKALAEAAGVSEALLFKHYPSKEALFTAMLASYAAETASDGGPPTRAVEASTATLVRIVHSFYARMIDKQGQPAGFDDAILARLMFRSLTEDAKFARSFLHQVSSRLVARIEECIPAAIEAGDMVADIGHHTLLGWFAHHLGVILLLHHLPDPPAVPYGVSRPVLVEQAVRFALRGIGLKEEAIRRDYRPEEWTEPRP